MFCICAYKMKASVMSSGNNMSILCRLGLCVEKFEKIICRHLPKGIRWYPQSVICLTIAHFCPPSNDLQYVLL